MPEKKIKGKTLRTQTTPYTSVPIELLTADVAMIKSTGEEIKISDTLLRVYLYMRNMYCITLDDPKSFGYFEGWEGIASAIGKTQDIFKKGSNRPNIQLQKLGLLELRKAGKGRADMKIVKDIVEILDDVVFLNSKSKDYKERKNKERETFLSESKQPEQEAISPPPIREHTPTSPTYEAPPLNVYDDIVSEGYCESCGERYSEGGLCGCIPF
ncbi:MAG: hypothetical protein GY861_10835 [bacterium]|nr:hypothetical protein [bacterium]